MLKTCQVSDLLMESFRKLKHMRDPKRLKNLQLK